MVCDFSCRSTRGLNWNCPVLAMAMGLFLSAPMFIGASEDVSHSRSTGTSGDQGGTESRLTSENNALVSPEVITPFVANLANDDLDKAQKALEQALKGALPKRCEPRITTLFPLDQDVVTSRCHFGFMSTADFSSTTQPQKVAAFGCLVCRSLKTPKVWSQRILGGYAYSPIDGASQFGLDINSWKLPVGAYEVGVLLFLQESPKAPISFGNSKTHRFRVEASLSSQEFAEKIATLRQERLQDARYKAALLEDYLHQVELTEAVWPVINQLTALEELNLSGLPVSDEMLERLAVLPYLSSVRLDQTSIRGDALAGLSRLPALTKLDISKTRLKEGQLTRISDLMRLRGLRMTHHVVDQNELRAVAKLSRLQELDLSYCQFSDGLPSGIFEAMTALKQLDIAGSSIANSELKEIAKMKSLEILNLAGTSISDAGIEHISGHASLESLDISKTSVSARCLKSVATLPRLKALALDSTLSNEGALQELRDRGIRIDLLPSSQDEANRHWASWK